MGEIVLRMVDEDPREPCGTGKMCHCHCCLKELRCRTQGQRSRGMGISPPLFDKGGDVPAQFLDNFRQGPQLFHLYIGIGLSITN